MAKPRDPSSAQRRPRAPAQRHQATRSQGVNKLPAQQPAQRRSERISQLQRGSAGRKPEKSQLSLSVEENQPLPLPAKRQKRLQEAEDLTNHVPIEPSQKQLRTSLFSPSRKRTFDQVPASGLSASQQSHINHWAHQGRLWPKEYFQYEMQPIIFRRKESAASFRLKRSEPSLLASTVPSDQKPRGEKSTPYQNQGYVALLQVQGGLYMKKSKQGITDASKGLCRNLLENKYPTPENTIFGDNAFENACLKLQDKNEARIIQDVARLLVPSAETLVTLGDERLAILVESVNEGWNNCFPAMNPRPQPDYAVGFGRSAFSDEQSSKLGHSLGHPAYLSRFMATYYMHFPFLTCEVKSATAALYIADRQNGHSMAVAVRGIVELFKLGKKESELHGELLTFSISHDHQMVRLHGYYPIIKGEEIEIYRHPIHAFDFTMLDGKEKWTTFNFTVGLYIYSLSLIKKIRSVIDDLPPDFNLEQLQASDPQTSGYSGLSQQLGTQVLAQGPGEQDSKVSHGDLRPINPDTSMQARPKKKTKRP